MFVFLFIHLFLHLFTSNRRSIRAKSHLENKQILEAGRGGFISLSFSLTLTLSVSLHKTRRFSARLALL